MPVVLALALGVLLCAAHANEVHTTTTRNLNQWGGGKLNFQLPWEDTCNGEWSSYGSCSLKNGSNKRCKLWVYKDPAEGQNSFNGGNSGTGNNGSGGGGGGGGSCIGADSDYYSTMWAGIPNPDESDAFYVGCVSNMKSMMNNQPNLRRSLQQQCPNFGTEECTTSGCEQGCQGTWSDYGSCFFDTAAGKTHKCRFFEPEATVNDYGGWADWQEDRRSLQTQCPKKECISDGCQEQKKDCVGGFSGFGPCKYDSAAHANKQCKTYMITQQATFGGQGCPYSEGFQVCTTAGCLQTVDCVGHWNSYGPCSPSGGTSMRCRTYVVETQAANGGQGCPYGAGALQCTPSGCAQPVDCEGYWMGFGSCSNGKKCRRYKVTKPESNGGQDCPAAHNQEECITSGCPQPVNCVGAWGPFHPCKKNPATNKNEKCREYEITTFAANGGAQCPHHNGKVECSDSCAQPVDCHGVWNYSPCNYNSAKHEWFKVKSYQHIVSASNGGVGCPYSNGYSTVITSQCSQPVDCEGEWSGYGECHEEQGDDMREDRRSLLGVTPMVRCRRYKITKSATNKGYDCPFLDDQVDCTENGCDAKVDCVGNWGAYEECRYDSEEHANKRCKTYSITTPASGGGAECPFSSGSPSCTKGGCVQPVDCQYETPYGSCEITNGVARRCKVFTPTVLAQHGGEACPYAAGHQMDCTTVGCAQPVDCEGHWEQGECEYNLGSHSNIKCAVYHVTKMSMNGGQECPHAHLQKECKAEGCAQPVDCEWNMYSNEVCHFDEATKTNVNCKMVEITQEPLHNGKECEYVNGQNDCSQENCAQPKHCVGAWGAYGSCQLDVGLDALLLGKTNVRCRVYSVLEEAANGGDSCPHVDGHKECTEGGCVQPVDCKYDWVDVIPPQMFDDGLGEQLSEFDDDEKVDLCHVDTVKGTAKKCKRVKITVPASHNGNDCAHPEGYEVCDLSECAQPVNCVGEWTDEGACEYHETSHAVKRCKTYVVSKASANGGMICPFPNNYKVCSVADCNQPVDCEYEWRPEIPPVQMTGGSGVGTGGSGNVSLAEEMPEKRSLLDATVASGLGDCYLDKTTGQNVGCKVVHHTTLATLYGKSCPYEHGHKACNAEKCEQPVNCHGEWSTYEECFHDVDDDTNKRCRTYSVVQPALNGGEECKYEHGLKSCTVAGCGQPIDCEHEWTSYGPCTFHASSGKNKMCRQFNVTTMPDNNGEQCPYPGGYTQCTDQGCPQPVDCVGHWQEPEECFYDKEGHLNKRCRKYKVTVPAAHGGAQCQYEDGEADCGQEGCAQPSDCVFGWFSKPQPLGAPDGQDLGLSDCQISEGKSQQCTYVSILKGAENNGYACPFPHGYKQCTTNNCTQPVDCVGAWKSYESCKYLSSTHKSERCREYEITTQAFAGGAECPYEHGETACTMGGCSQPVDCKFELVNPTSCELHDDADGIDQVNRQCKTAKIVTPAAHNGLSCPYTDGEKVCTTEGCSQPVDCIGQWFEEENCKYSAFEHVNIKCSTYKITQQAKYGGAECPTKSGEKMCTKFGCAQPVDCVHSWEVVNNGTCIFDEEKMERKTCSRMVVDTPNSNHGKECPYAVGHEMCTKDTCKQPRACEGEWTEFNECHLDAGIKANKRCRKYKVTSPAVAGGPACPFTDGEEQCITGGCSQPVDCEYEWLSDGTCKYNDATKSNDICKTFSILTAPAHGGEKCPYVSGHRECAKEDCVQPIHCAGVWGEYDQCFHDEEADANKRCRTYSIIQQASNGGQQCVFEDGLKSCTTSGCGQPVDCEYDWTPYGTCEYYASSNSNKRCRQYNVTTVPDNNGQQCQHLNGYQQCTIGGCAQPVDCVGAWEEYDQCYYEAGDHSNKRCRLYKVSVEAKHGGAQCPHVNGDTQCDKNGCQQPVDCSGHMTDFTGQCAFDAEDGENKDCKTFVVDVQAAHGGKQCLHLGGEQVCSADVCDQPQKCVGSWGAFDLCAFDDETGENQKCRTYKIAFEAKDNGEACPHEDGETECVAEGCAQPVDCVGAFQAYGECQFDANEHENKRCRSYSISIEAVNGGVQCPHEHGHVECNHTLCAQPVDCVGSFSDIGECFYSEGGDHQNKACKTYTVAIPAANGGTQCPHADGHESCSSSVCDQPVDCVGSFVKAPNCTLNANTEEWESCSTFRIQTPASHNGNQCAHVDYHEVCEPCAADQVPVDCEYEWQETVTDECASAGHVKNCSVFTVTQEPNEYGEQCPHEAGYSLCKNEACPEDNNGSDGQDGSDGQSAGKGGVNGSADGSGDDKETSTASTTDALMYGGIALAALCCCCLPLAYYYRRKKQRQAALSQSVEGRKYSLLNYGNPNMVSMPVGANTTMMQNPFFGGESGARGGSLGGEVTFNSNPLGEQDYGAEGSGFEASTEVSGRGSVNEGFFNPMFVQEQHEEVVGSLQQNMYAMYDYIDSMCEQENESMAFGDIKKDMQEAMISWTQIEETLIDTEGQNLTTSVTTEDMEEKLKAIRQKLNKIEQSAFMCRDINTQEKSSLSNMINQARGKLRRVSTVGGAPNMNPRRKTTMPTEWRNIRMKLKTVKALRGDQ